MILTTTNPPLTDGLIDRLIDIWVATTNAGGAVGFVAPASRDHVEREVATFWDRRLDRDLDLVVATESEAVLGFGFLQPGRGVSAHLGEISKLQRDPAASGRGVGARLLEALEALAVDRGLTLVWLGVREGTGREEYYRLRGYEHVALLPGWLRIAGPARALLMMAKTIGADAGRSVHELAGSANPPRDAPVPGSRPHLGLGAPPVPAAGALPVAVQRLDPELPLPSYAQAGDAGLDLYARKRMVLPPGGRQLMATGVAVAIPEGYVGLVHPRSGLAVKLGLSIINTPGTIDAGYRGELLVPLINLDPSVTIRLDRGDRIAQLLIQRVEHASLVEVDQLPDGVRGGGGFGSTGR